jgi:hypothetical protein
MSSRASISLHVVSAFAVAGSLIACSSGAGSSAPTVARSDPVSAATAPMSTTGPIDPSNFVTTVDNPYYPLPVGRVMVYQGIRDGVAQTDTVTVTSATKVIEGVRAVVVRDLATDTHHRTLEATLDWFAQDKQGNVWYLGEDTKAYNPDGSVDTSGSWMAGVNGATPGFIMEAHPKIPDAYRQEYLKGQAEDTAWIVGTGGSATIPYGTVHNTVRSLEVTVLEPDVVDEKIYAPGVGIVSERSLAGPQEVAKLVSVTG